MQTQYSVLDYKIDLYFNVYKLAIAIDENGLIDRNIGYEIRRQKVIEQEFGWKFLRDDSDK